MSITRTIIGVGGGGGYSYVYVLPDTFFFKLMKLDVILKGVDKTRNRTRTGGRGLGLADSDSRTRTGGRGLADADRQKK